MLRRSPRAIAGTVASLAVVTLLWMGAAERANAQTPAIMAPGDPIVTGFSGVLPPVPPFPSGDPLDETFINLDGASMEIQRLLPPGPPAGQLIPSPTLFAAPARVVGQAFAIALDDQLVPNIYLGATSAYGIQIVTPDVDGDGRPERVKTGQPGAEFMQGQWGAGGAPGSIYRVDGTTGAISLFTSIGANAGPGLGDVVFDRASHQLRIEHHVKRIDPKISFCLLAATIHFNHVAQTLKSVERESDRKNDSKQRDRVTQIQETGHRSEVGIEKIEILKKEQKGAQRNHA